MHKLKLSMLSMQMFSVVQTRYMQNRRQSCKRNTTIATTKENKKKVKLKFEYQSLHILVTLHFDVLVVKIT